MHHKRGKSKNQRAGCLLCKPNKMPGFPKHAVLGHAGFGKIRKESCAREDIRAES